MIDMTTTAAPRRRPDGGGYARGEETRTRIIAAALTVFADEGYARAATRQIADGAGVNPPALQYYFDSKEGLHRACAEFIIDRVLKALGPTMAAVPEAAASGDPDVMMEALCAMLDALADFCLTVRDEPSWSRFMARGDVDDAGPAFGMIREGITRPIHQAFCALIGPLIGRPVDDEATKLRTVVILSPLSSFHVHRIKTLAMLGWEDFGEMRGDAVRAVLRAHTRAAILAAKPS